MNKQLKKKACRLSAITLSFLLGTTCILGDTLFSIRAEDTSTNEVAGENQPVQSQTEENGDESEEINEPTEEVPETGAEGVNQDETSQEEDLNTPDISEDELESENQGDSTSSDDDKPEEIEEVAPDVISMNVLKAATEALPANAGITENIETVDRDGNPLENPNVTQLDYGWIKDQRSLHRDLTTSNGNHYSFYRVLANGLDVLYITEYLGEIYYSTDGLVGTKVEPNTTFKLVYWQYYQVSFSYYNNENLYDFAEINVANQELIYKDNSVLNYRTLSVQDISLSHQNNIAKIFKGGDLFWTLKPKSKSAWNSYIVKNIKLDDVDLNLSDHKYGGSFNSSIDKDSEVVIEMADNLTSTYTIIGDNLEGETITGTYTQANEVEISFSQNSSGAAITSLVFELPTGQRKEVNFSTGQSASIRYTLIDDDVFGCSVYIKRNYLSQGSVWRNYSVKIVSNDPNGSNITDDFKIYTSGWNLDISSASLSYEVSQVDAMYLKNGILIPAKNGDPVKLEGPILKRTATFFYKAKKGYEVEIGSGAHFTAGLVSDLEDKAIAEIAESEGYTHYAIFNADTVINDGVFTIPSNPIDAKVIFEGSTKDNVTTNISDNKVISIPDYTPLDKNVIFYGWMLNGDINTIYEKDSKFSVDNDTWDLGKSVTENGKAVQLFEFKPVLNTEYLQYQVNYYLQKKDGNFGDTPDSVDNSYVQIGNEERTVVVIPKVIDNYTFNQVYTDKHGNRVIHLPSQGNATPQLNLYYDQSFDRIDINVSEKTTGKLGDKTKKFEYKIIAAVVDPELDKNPLLGLGSDWIEEGKTKVKTFTLSNGEDVQLDNLPTNNCEYQIIQTTQSGSYKTTVNGSESYQINLTGDTLAKDQNVEFINEAKDTILAGLGLNDSNFNLLLPFVLVCGIGFYLFVKKKIRD